MSLKLGLRNKIRRSRAGGFTPLLDQSFATGATAAYSLRRLKSSATKAVRVREDGSNTETDIGFSGGTLDETALLNHCGSNNGFVSKWYDQSGNGNDASNKTASEQPQIVNSGSVIKENGKPAIEFNRSVLNLTNISIPTPFATVLVGTAKDASILQRFIDSDVTFLFLLRATGKVEVKNGSSLAYNYPTSNYPNQTLYTHLIDGANSELYRDGNLITSGDAGNSTVTRISLGATPGINNELVGTEQEVIIFGDFSFDRSKVDDNIKTFYGI